jgi:WD40 repeat protein
MRDGQFLHIFAGQICPVWSVSFSPDDQLLASSSVDNTIELWQVGDGQRLRTLQSHRVKVNAVTFTIHRNRI